MEALNEINRRLSNVDSTTTAIEKRVSMLEVNQQHMTERWEDIHDRTFGVIGELRAILLEKIADLSKTVREDVGELTHILKDNGQAGLVTRVFNLEAHQKADVARREADEENAERVDRKFTLATPYALALMTAIGGVIGWLITKFVFK